jgi:ADP-ribose pyrophosphatase
VNVTISKSKGKDPEILEELPVFPAGRMTLVEGHILMKGGTKVTKHYMKDRDAAVVLAITDDDKIVLTRNWRPAPGTPDKDGKPMGRWVWELPSGTFEPGEDETLCAGRELKEETGYTAKDVRRIRSLGIYHMPGRSSMKAHYFIATGLELKKQRLEDDEAIDVKTFGADELLDMLNRNEIESATALIGILYYTSVVKGMPLKGRLG